MQTGIGHSCHFLLLAEELSTVPLNLKAMSNNTTWLYNLFTGLFIVSFIFSRLVYGSIICWYTFIAVPSFIQMALRAHDGWSVVIILMQATLCLLTRMLNIYWTILIGRKIGTVFRGNRRSVSIQHQETARKNQ